MMGFDSFFGRHQRALAWLGLLFAFPVIFWAGFSSGSSVSFSGYYLIAIGFAAWRLGKVPAYGVAALSLICLWFVRWEVPPLDDTLLLKAVDAGSTLIVLSAFCYLASKAISLAAEMRELSDVDTLTGATVWRVFRERVAIELMRLKRYGYPVSLIYFALDDLQPTNQEQGHISEDNLLKELVACIVSTLRVQDVIGRAREGEFAILLPETNQDEAKPLVERIQKTVEGIAERLGLPVSLNIGVVTARGGSDANPDDLLHGADSLLNSVKRAGKKVAAYNQI